jgi:hypothetical protein
MSKSNEGPLSKKIGMTRRRVKRIKGGKGLSHPFSTIAPKQINKVNQPKLNTRLQIYLGKNKGISLYNVEDVRGITYVGTSLTKEKE